jgi:hypothetical protein
LTRTDSLEEERFEAGEAVRPGRSAARSPGGPGGGGDPAEREPMVWRGARQRGREALASVKLWVIGRRAVGPAGRWMTAGELVASRGDHDFGEGKALEGDVQERLRPETRPWNSSLPGNR